MPGYAKILEGVERGLRKRGYKLLFRTWKESDSEADWDTLLGLGCESECEGYILVAPTEERIVRHFKSAEVPFILLDTPAPIRGVNCVSMDYKSGARQAVRYLIKLGHVDIGYIGQEQSPKYQAYVEEMRDPRFRRWRVFDRSPLLKS